MDTTSFENVYGTVITFRLKKSVYGLKQSPRAWFDCFSKTKKKYGYTQAQTDHTLFFRKS